MMAPRHESRVSGLVLPRTLKARVDQQKVATS